MNNKTTKLTFLIAFLTFIESINENQNEFQSKVKVPFKNYKSQNNSPHYP